MLAVFEVFASIIVLLFANRMQHKSVVTEKAVMDLILLDPLHTQISNAIGTTTLH